MVTVACLLVTAGLAGVAAAHGNHLTVDPQVSSDGTVVVENFFLQNGGYLVLHADKGGEPGKVVGVRQFGSGYHSSVPIRMDRQFWRSGGDPVTVWVTLHRSDGDGRFERRQDEIFRSFGGFAGRSVPVAKTDSGRAYVVAANPFEVRQTTDGPNVTIRNVSLASDGYVALHATEQDYSPGQVVGQTALPAGTHENVTVSMNASYYRSLDARYDLWAVVHTSDGDGSFDPTSDTVLKAGNETVGSFFSLEKAGAGGGNLVNTPAGGDETATGAATTTGTSGESLVNTPTPTTASSASLVNTPAPTATNASA